LFLFFTFTLDNQGKINEKNAEFEAFGNTEDLTHGHTGGRMRFMTTGDVAAACQVTIPTVKRWIREGYLKAFQTAGGHYRITEEELERFLAAQNIPVVPPARQDLPRVLVVDDEAPLVEMLSDALTALGRYEVEIAQDGYEGLIKVGSFRPHVLILDLRMPGLDGFQVCRRVKADPTGRATRILVLTGHAQADTAVKVAQAGADAFLEKPVQLTRLQAEVDRLLSTMTIGLQPIARAMDTTQ
jgi:excisionase family DNA binding protein